MVSWLGRILAGHPSSTIPTITSHDRSAEQDAFNRNRPAALSRISAAAAAWTSVQSRSSSNSGVMFRPA